MQYYWQLYLWENGGKVRDFQDHLTAPIFIEDKLDETLDTAEVVLKLMPISTRDAFPPKTKFRLERYATEDFTDVPKTWDFVVEHDDVEEYMGCPEICTHRIHLIEASVVAQGMHVDNIALTYALQDVTLNYKTTVDSSATIGNTGGLTSINQGHDRGIRETPALTYVRDTTQEFLFENSYRYVWRHTGTDQIGSLKAEVSARSANQITFTVPTLMCQGANSTGTWDAVSRDLFEVHTVTYVEKALLRNKSEVSRETVLIRHVRPESLPNAANEWYIANNGEVAYTALQEEAWGRIGIPEGYNYPYTAFPWRVAREDPSQSDKSVTFNTDILSDAEINDGYEIVYYIKTWARSWEYAQLVTYYGAKITTSTNIYTGMYRSIESMNPTTISASSVYSEARFMCKSMDNESESGPFLAKGIPYNCYDLLRRTLLTIDTHVIDNSTEGLDEYDSNSNPQPSLQHPIIVNREGDEDWEYRLKTTAMYETIFEQKNLWEVMLQIGYYLHAIPYLEFATDGTDRFILNFRQLGATKEKDDTNTKITVFNSRNLSEYFTQFDSYVTNLFSPQNVIEEWIVPKTSDSSYLVSNDTAELHTCRPILEILEFDVTYDGSIGGTAGTESILHYVFEESIYQILTSDSPAQITPAKGNSLYYKLGDNKILGLNYVAPSKNTGGTAMSLKYILERLFAVQHDSWTENVTFNNLRFRIKYRTQDDTRISQVRPDIQNFVRNSAYEKYPHHEQYYGAQDKIVDSERFSANLFGQLIRVGNTIYQRQERVAHGDEKESGDLVYINGIAHYVTEVENEYYFEEILQKVTYSRDFNQLSNIVTIPSEPRFYEVSERSKIRREVRIMEFFELSTRPPESVGVPRFISGATWRNFLKTLIFNGDGKLPNFAYTRFKADKRRVHTRSNLLAVSTSQLFPSSEVERTGVNTVTPKSASDHADCIVPLSHSPLRDGVVFGWDMVDNFKAGDFIDVGLSGKPITGTDRQIKDGAYLAQQPMRYVDVFGRADLFSFKLFNKTDWTNDQKPQLPRAVIAVSDADTIIGVQGGDNMGIALDKDNREELSFNYQINLLHRASDGDDDFFTFPNLFGDKEKGQPLKMCFINKPQGRFNEKLRLSDALIVADDVSYSLVDSQGAIEVQITAPGGIDLNEVKSIVLYQEKTSGERNVYIIKNVNKMPVGDRLKSWWIYPVFNT